MEELDTSALSSATVWVGIDSEIRLYTYFPHKRFSLIRPYMFSVTCPFCIGSALTLFGEGTATETAHKIFDRKDIGLYVSTLFLAMSSRMRLAIAPGPTVHWLFRSHDLPSKFSAIASRMYKTWTEKACRIILFIIKAEKYAGHIACKPS